MMAYYERVVDEKAQLDERLRKLCALINNTDTMSVFRNLTEDERMLLLRQRDVMQDYSAILGKRISMFQV